jgi:hypothetical protein
LRQYDQLLAGTPDESLVFQAPGSRDMNPPATSVSRSAALNGPSWR